MKIQPDNTPTVAFTFGAAEFFEEDFFYLEEKHGKDCPLLKEGKLIENKETGRWDYIAPRWAVDDFNKKQELVQAS